MATTAGQLVIDLVANVAGLKTDLAKANKTLDDFAGTATRSLSALTKTAGSFMGAFAGIGVALGGAQLATLAKQAIEAADNIGDMAERLGVGTDALQALQYAARDVGADAEGMATGIAKLNKILGEAGAGNKEAIKSFADLGVAFGEAGKLRSTEDVLRSVADRIAGAGSVAEKTRLAVEVFGKSGAALVPIFAKGAAGIDELIAKLREMGVIIDGNALKQADALQKQFDQLAATLQTTLIKAVLAFAPALTFLATETQKSAEWFARLVDRVKDLAAAPFGDVETKIRRLREEQERLRKYAPADIRLPQGAKELKQLEDERDAANERKREAARAAQAGGALGGTAITAPVDPGAAKKARDAEFKALTDRLTFEEIAREQRDRDAQTRAEVAKKLAEGETEAAYKTLLASLEYDEKLTQAKWEEHAKRVKLAQDAAQAETDAAYRAVYDQLAITQAGEDERAEQMKRNNEKAKEELAKAAAAYQPIVDGINNIFGAVERAFSTSVTGIIQGTVTLEKAFQNMGQSIAISLGETAVKEGVEVLKKALKELLQSQMVQQLIRSGLGALGGMFTSGAAPGVTVAPVQNIGVQMAAAGGIVQSPTFAVVGEAGPEAIVPLDRWGEMGGGVTINIIDQRREGNVQTQEKTTASGERQVDVLITDVVRSGIAGGAYDRALGGSFGLSRRGVHR